MKKVFLILVMVIVTLVGGAVFAACGTPPTTQEPEPPVAPTLEKSSFSIYYSVGQDDSADYSLVWNSEDANEYKVVCDGTETTVTKSEISLNGYAADTVHTVTVTAIGEEDLQSDPVEVKFKGTKLTMPYNVRLYGDTKSFGWKGCEETSAYRLSCEELDLDDSSKPVGTGKFKYTFAYSDRLAIDELRAIFLGYNLYELESFRVQSMPYNSNSKRFEYTDETEIIEFQLPSDFSEQSVNFYAGKMSNPYNLRWDFEGFDKHPGYAYVKWDGAYPQYKYMIKVKTPGGWSTGMESETGASQGRVTFGDDRTGDYTVTVEPQYYEFNYIGEDKAAKSVTYMFYLPQLVTEELHFHINETVLDVPKNIRIEGDNIVWDGVEYARSYSVNLVSDDDTMYLSSSGVAQLSLNEVYESVTLFLNSHEGIYGVSVSASGIYPVLASFENNVPVINTYHYSEKSEIVPNLVKVKAIPTVQNVRVDYENNTIYWDGIPEAVSYRVGFYKENGSGHSSFLGEDTQYTWDEDISDYSVITVEATCEYQVTNEDGIVTVIVPSLYKIEI